MTDHKSLTIEVDEPDVFRFAWRGVFFIGDIQKQLSVFDPRDINTNEVSASLSIKEVSDGVHEASFRGEPVTVVLWTAPVGDVRWSADHQSFSNLHRKGAVLHSRDDWAFSHALKLSQTASPAVYAKTSQKAS